MAINKPFMASAVMGFICFMTLNELQNVSDLFALFAGFLASSSSYFLALVVVSGGTKDIREYFSYGRLIFFKKINFAGE